MYYILKKEYGHSKTISKLIEIKQIMKVLNVSEDKITRALTSSFNDFEDAVQYYCALDNNLNSPLKV
jgi:hypothetical protein